MAYIDFKYLPRKATSDNGLRGKAFEIAKDPKYDGYQRGLQWFTNCLTKNQENLSHLLRTQEQELFFDKVPEN